MQEQIEAIKEDMKDRIVYLYDLTDEEYEILMERVVEIAEELRDERDQAGFAVDR